MYLHGANGKGDINSISPNFFVDKVFTERGNDYTNNLTDHMINTICEFTKNRPVYLVRPTPEIKQHVPNTMFRSLALNNKASITIRRDEYIKRQEAAFKMQDEAIERCGAKMLDPTPYLCDSKYCYGDIDGIPLYYDDDHLSSYGSEIISPIYDEVFQ